MLYNIIMRIPLETNKNSVMHGKNKMLHGINN